MSDDRDRRGVESPFTATTRADSGRLWLVLSFRARPEPFVVPTWGEIFSLPAAGEQSPRDVVRGAAACEVAFFNGATQGRLVPAGSAHQDTGWTLLEDVAVWVDVSGLPRGRYLVHIDGMTGVFDVTTSR